MPQVRFLVAVDEEYGIAKNGKIPWDTPGDVEYFRAMTKFGTIVSGTKTLSSLSEKYRQDKKIFAITHQNLPDQGLTIVHDLDQFFKELVEDVWIIGGGQIFAQALPYATHMFVTRISGSYDCDVFFPKFEDNFTLLTSSTPQHENGIDYVYEIWSRA